MTANPRGSLTLTARKWAPSFAQGQVRDHRVRWMLKEIGCDYDVDLIDPGVQESGAYRGKQPFANPAAWRDRWFARPAYRAAIAEQCADFAGHGPKDLGWDQDTEGETE